MLLGKPLIRELVDKIEKLYEVIMAKKKARKKLTPLEKIRKELDKLEALHDKENDIVERINDIIDEEDNDWDDVSYGGTNGD